MREATEKTLQQVFRAVLQLSDDVDVRTIGQVTHPSWDSLAHVSLVAAIESEFNLSIDIADSLGLTSYDAFGLFLEAQGL